MRNKLQSASLLTAAAVFLFLLPAADTNGCGGGDVIIGDDGGGGGISDDDGGTGGTGTGTGTGTGSTGGCVITGCSSQICAEMEMASTCEWQESYACYQLYGVCEKDANDSCGWAQNQDLLNCLALVDQCPSPSDSCMNPTNHQECLDIAKTCDGQLAILESCPLQFACEPRQPVTEACVKNAGDACTTDADCTSGGCGGEVCYNPAISDGISTCECGPAPYSCGCVNGTCSWWQ